ncbi:DUF6534 domain-containing protein [Rhodotorula paludigena]|uniref:DUF6534 domain-containing protein n=1 Tax=Rhodotorula paludigena TaxID=86838 RepID=UPI0031744810
MSDSGYEDVWMLEAPPGLAAKMIGPLAAGYAAELVFFGMYSMLFIQHCTTGQFSALRSRALKVTLVVLFVLQAALSAFNFAEMYKSMVRQSRTIDWIASGTPEWNMIPLLGGLIAAISQAVLSQRAGAFIQCRRVRYAFYVWMSLLICLTLFGSLAATTIGFIWTSDGMDWRPDLNWNTAIAVWMWVSAVADVSISATFAVSLRRRRAGFSSNTDSLLNRLAWYSVRTASYTAFVALGGAIAASIFRDSEVAYTNLACAFICPLPPLYGLGYFTTVVSSRQAIQNAFGSSKGGDPTLPAHRQDVVKREKASSGSSAAVATPHAALHMTGLPADVAPLNATPSRRSRLLGMTTSHKYSRSTSSIDDRSLRSLYLRPGSSGGRVREASGRGGTASANGNVGELRIHVEQEVERTIDEPEPEERRYSTHSREGSFEGRRSALGRYRTGPSWDGG